MDLPCSRPRGVRRNTSSHFAAAALAGMPHSFTLVSGGRFVSVRCVRVRALVFCLPVCLTVDASECLSVFVGVCWAPAIYVRACLSVRRFSDAMSRTVQWMRQERLKEWCVVCVERVEQQGHMSAGSLRRTSRRTFCSNGTIMRWTTRQGCKDSSHPKIKAVNGDRPANGVIDSARVERAIWPTAQDECARGPGAGVDRWNSSLPPLVRDRHGGQGPPTPVRVRLNRVAFRRSCKTKRVFYACEF